MIYCRNLALVTSDSAQSFARPNWVRGRFFKKATCHIHRFLEFEELLNKGPVKLIKTVKIALLFFHVTPKLFQFTILNLCRFQDWQILAVLR